MWVFFQDKYMHGEKQTNYDYILIQGNKQEAVEKFKQHFGFHPLEIVCDICESHYSTESGETMEQATGYIRNCKFSQSDGLYVEEPADLLEDYLTVEELLVLKDVYVLK